MGHGEIGALEASARVTWAGWSGQISGSSGLLNARTATQVELGGPGGGTNPEELLAAALANCYTSTLTSLARVRKLDLVSIETTANFLAMVWKSLHRGHNLV
jgi:organic hydroperoxide reductase OsmC/OhrA